MHVPSLYREPSFVTAAQQSKQIIRCSGSGWISSISPFLRMNGNRLKKMMMHLTMLIVVQAYQLTPWRAWRRHVYYIDPMHAPSWLKSMFKIQHFLLIVSIYTLPDQPSSKLYIIPYIFSCIPVFFSINHHYLYEKSTTYILHRATIMLPKPNGRYSLRCFR